MSMEFDFIISSVAGDYTIRRVDGSLVTCKARGLFRLKKISPCTGDRVTLDRDNDENEYVISEIHERRNVLVRPPLANLDCAVIVVSSCEPKPNALVLDRLTVIMDNKDIESVFVFTKSDKKENLFFETYQRAGFTCFCNDDVDLIREFLRGKTSALIGNTGVGKTTLLNRLIPGLDKPTAEISKKLGRGKHTTRTVEFHELVGGTESGFVADTPGFSTVETKVYGEILSGDVALNFREFVPFIGTCKFGGCTHHGEEGCKVCESVGDAIPQSRYDSFLAVYEESRVEENKW